MSTKSRWEAAPQGSYSEDPPHSEAGNLPGVLATEEGLVLFLFQPEVLAPAPLTPRRKLAE